MKAKTGQFEYRRVVCALSVGGLVAALVVTAPLPVWGQPSKDAAAGNSAAETKQDSNPAAREPIPEPPRADSGPAPSPPPSPAPPQRAPNTLAAEVRAAARGVRVLDVDPTGAAARAGIRPGDVILSLDGHPVSSPSELNELVAQTQPGSKVPAVVWSYGRELSLSIDLSVRPAEPNRIPDAPPDRRAWLGVDLGESDRGVFVTRVHPGGPAEQAGVAAGDVIVSLDGQQVSTVSDVLTRMGQLTPGNQAQLVVQRDGKESTLTVVLGTVSVRPYVNRYYGRPWWGYYRYGRGGGLDLGPLHVEW